MAEHAVVNITQLNSDLTKIADNIREIRDISGKLSFPEGMVNELNEIQARFNNPFIELETINTLSRYGENYQAKLSSTISSNDTILIKYSYNPNYGGDTSVSRSTEYYIGTGGKTPDIMYLSCAHMVGYAYYQAWINLSTNYIFLPGRRSDDEFAMDPSVTIYRCHFVLP